MKNSNSNSTKKNKTTTNKQQTTNKKNIPLLFALEGIFFIFPLFEQNTIKKIGCPANTSLNRSQKCSFASSSINSLLLQLV